MSETYTEIIDDGRAKRNAVILAVAQSLYGASSSVLIIVGGLVGYLLAEDKSLATVPITSFIIGTALTTIPAAMLMRKVGRRIGFVFGAGLGALGAILGACAIWAESLILLSGVRSDRRLSGLFRVLPVCRCRYRQ